jgi:hypothetical protein
MNGGHLELEQRRELRDFGELTLHILGGFHIGILKGTGIKHSPPRFPL